MNRPIFNINKETSLSLFNLNENAVHVLEQNPEKIQWYSFLKMKSTVHILQNNMNELNPSDLKLINYLNDGILCEQPDLFRLFKIKSGKFHWKEILEDSIEEDIIKNQLSSIFHWYALSYNRHQNAIRIIEKNLDKLNVDCWGVLSGNPNAIHIIEQNIDKIIWKELSMNPNAIHILENNLDKVDWLYLSKNPNAIHILEQNIDKIIWRTLSENPNAINILEKNLDKVHWHSISSNPNAIHLIEKNLDKVDWHWLSLNPNAIHILKKNIDKINWISLSANRNAIKIIEKNLDKVYWQNLSGNINAIRILEENLDKIYWYNLSYNVNAIHIIAPLDHDAMKKQIEPLKKELTEYVFHPSRLRRLCDMLSVDLATLLSHYQ